MSFLVRELPKTSEFIMTTNLQSPIQILGVGKLNLRDDKQSKWRKGYVALYTENGAKKKCEINQELYDALHLLYSSLDNLGEERFFATGCSSEEYFNEFTIEPSDFLLPSKEDLHGQ
jgi:hypothetical protein